MIAARAVRRELRRGTGVLVKLTYLSRVTEQMSSPDGRPLFRHELIGVWSRHVTYCRDFKTAFNLLVKWNGEKPWEFQATNIEDVRPQEVPPQERVWITEHTAKPLTELL